MMSVMMSEIKYISSTQLAKNLNVLKSRLDDVLVQMGLIENKEGAFVLTKLGEEKGGRYLKHRQYGTYIAWPEEIDIPELSVQSDIAYLNATKIATQFNLTAQKINMMLSEIGWIERYLKGWTITNLGKQQGGIQKENTKNGIPYVEWPIDTINNSTFKAVLKEVQGDAGETSNVQTNTKYDDFRSKFEAKHRSTDGHFVRSKAEMLIDNWLYMAEIVHAYERKLPVEEEVYCDFYIPTGKVYIEYWGLENDQKYLERKAAKKAIYEKYNFKLIELNENDINNLDDVLPRMLLKFGVQTY